MTIDAEPRTGRGKRWELPWPAAVRIDVRDGDLLLGSVDESGRLGKGARVVPVAAVEFLSSGR
jgi:hypothetical protein